MSLSVEHLSNMHVALSLIPIMEKGGKEGGWAMAWLKG
jgi:hypothetical protein